MPQTIGPGRAATRSQEAHSAASIKTWTSTSEVPKLSLSALNAANMAGSIRAS